MARRLKTAITTYVYYHTQSPGYQVRKKKSENGQLVYDISRYFGISKHGSLWKAERAAREWKNRNIRRW